MAEREKRGGGNNGEGAHIYISGGRENIVTGCYVTLKFNSEFCAYFVILVLYLSISIQYHNRYRVFGVMHLTAVSLSKEH